MQNLWSIFVRWIAAISGLKQTRAHHFYPRTLNKYSTVVDLGAHKGDFSRFISTEYQCSVLGVEANPTLYDALPKLPSVRFLNVAIYKDDRSVVFNLSDNQEASSVFEENAELTGPLSKITVAGRTLDSLLKNNGIKTVDLLKVDIESAEFQMLELTPDDLLSQISQITVEFHISPAAGEFSTERFHAICSRLRRLGFLDLAMDRDFTDVLFLNTNRIDFNLTERMAMVVHRQLIMPSRIFTRKS